MQSSWWNTSSKKGTPARIPCEEYVCELEGYDMTRMRFSLFLTLLFPSSFASVGASPTTKPP